MKRSPRALYAAGLLTALTGALLVAWFVSGWADVRGRQRMVRDAPHLAADQRGAELAHELRSELGALISREVERPYYHYQNLFHDPRSSEGISVAPSPLAAERDPLVLGYFQLDAKGRATTPTINDELPELSEPKRLADNRRFRDEVTRSLVAPLSPRDAPARVAALQPATPVRPVPPQAASPASLGKKIKPRAPLGKVEPVQQQSQVVKLDPSAYLQNVAPNFIYKDRKGSKESETQDSKESQESQRAPPPPPRVQAAREVPDRDAGPPIRPALTAERTRAEPPRPITIIVSPLEWRTLPFAEQPAIVAVRQVDTPDGVLAQGFVVDRTALTSWLASRAGDAVAELRTGDDGSTEIAPGWHLEVAANPLAVTAAAAEAAAVARGFIVRFVAVGAIAILAALMVVMMVVRAERLARERSQFAAAAAHELRTPLAGLQLYGDMLADGLGDPGKLRDYARRMSEEASRLGRVVSNVLGFSQLERGNLSVEPRTGPLGDALRELAERAEPALDRAGAALALDVSPDLDARFDRDALARIVGNLLDNAEKYSRGADDRTITLTARAAGSAVEVVVSDRGPGVTQNARARLFRPFSRGVTTDGPAGLGLGLALSQSLARAMGGELAYRPDAGGGASFVLTLRRDAA